MAVCPGRARALPAAARHSSKRQLRCAGSGVWAGQQGVRSGSLLCDCRVRRAVSGVNRSECTELGRCEGSSRRGHWHLPHTLHWQPARAVLPVQQPPGGVRPFGLLFQPHLPALLLPRALHRRGEPRCVPAYSCPWPGTLLSWCRCQWQRDLGCTSGLRQWRGCQPGFGRQVPMWQDPYLDCPGPLQGRCTQGLRRLGGCARSGCGRSTGYGASKRCRLLCGVFGHMSTVCRAVVPLPLPIWRRLQLSSTPASSPARGPHGSAAAVAAAAATPR